MCNKIMSFGLGFSLGQVYYYYLLKDISFHDDLVQNISLGLSLFLGVLNMLAVQIRCISLLTIPSYCGKPGRGVLKAIILTYVVAGPISNMIYNATEVVRLYACTTDLYSNLTKTGLKSDGMSLENAFITVNKDIKEANHTFRLFLDITSPIEHEIEGKQELDEPRMFMNLLDDLFVRSHRTLIVDTLFRTKANDSIPDVYSKGYIRKLIYRFEGHVSKDALNCLAVFSNAYERCFSQFPRTNAKYICCAMDANNLCNVSHGLLSGVCNFKKMVDPGIGEGYWSLIKAKQLFVHNFSVVYIQRRTKSNNLLPDKQDAKETGSLVKEAFNEKVKIVYAVITIVYICVALLFLRIVNAAVTYHDLYLSEIDYDNLYVTGYFKLIDRRRKAMCKYSLLPLKKMERSKYTDVQSFQYGSKVREKLINQILKLSFDVVTATTFVMLDRLFYEALDVVRQYADKDEERDEPLEFDVEVEGSGLLAKVMRTILTGLCNRINVKHDMSNRKCLPCARLMPSLFFYKIYGGFLWILILLIVNPFTIRLRRFICSYFYPCREKRRILHLYNDILKKRMKMEKTLRTKAVQTVRAHYLTGENLLSLRMKYPQVLGWLKILPAARMNCLICGETEPNSKSKNVHETWHLCVLPKCPFVYCPECWREVGSHCIACDPSLAQLSDVNSLTEDEHWK